MLDIFTRREIHVLIALTAILVLGMFVGYQTLEDWSLPAMIFIVLPLGIYLVTDQERIERLNSSENQNNDTKLL